MAKGKKIWKKLVAVMLTAAMVAGTTGCGGKGADSAGSTTNESASESEESVAAPEESAGETTESDVETNAGGYEAIEKPESLSWCSHDGLDPVNGQEEWDAEFERLTGIKLEHTYVTGNEYNSKIELDYAADTVPDIFDLASFYYPKYAATGALADLTDLVKESGLYDLVDEQLWEQCSYNGRIYGVPKELPSATVTYVRKDWLDRLGMDVPTTYDEFIEMLTRFRDEIDECLSPLTGAGLVSTQYLPDMWQGATPDFKCIDGVWVDGMLQENTAVALQKMQDAYTSGLLDMEVITNTTATCRDAWIAGTTGAFCYWAGNWGEKLTVGLQKNVPEAEVIAIPPIEGSVYETSTPTVHVINGRLPEERVAQLFKYFIHYMHDGNEGQVLFEFGVEGVHWEQDGNNVKMLPSLSDPSVALNKCYIVPDSRITPLDLDDKNIEYSEMYVDSLEVGRKYASNRSFQKPSETYSLISADWISQRDSIIAEIVTGNLSVEEGLESYKAVAESLNVAQVLEEMNAQ